MPVAPRDVLRAEADAVLAAADRLDEAAFTQAVDLLAGTTGTVHVLGSGKSGIIGRKLASTLSSTGTPANFLHPSDAMHGDLGVVREGDIAVALSNSGESEEVLAALPYLVARSVPIIAVVGNLNSTLARRAQAVLDAAADVEACPLGLAPTTTTTVALALCDALAVGTMQQKGVTAEAFARNHPSGRLGRRLTLAVRDLMRDDVVCVSPGDGFLHAVDAIGKGGVGAVPVVADGVLAGIVTDGDVRRALERHQLDELGSLQVSSMMTAGPVTTAPDVLAYDALRLMEDRPSQITVLPVVEGDGAVRGVLRLHDLVRAGL